MCFPRLNKCFCCLSLRTGMFLIIWISLVWNTYFLFVEDQPPLILQFLDGESYLTMTRYQLIKLGQLYYATEMLIMSFALMGIFGNKSFCLNLLVVSETILLLSYFMITLAVVNRSITRTASPFAEHSAAMLLVLGIKYYLYLVIISFHYEVMHGRDGRVQGGWVVTIPPSASAPLARDLPVETAQFLETTYPIQPPYAPIIAQPHPLVYTQNEQLIPQMSGHPQPYPFSPPPYPVPPKNSINENPPPYAP